MCSKIWMLIVVVLAVLVAAIAAAWPQERIVDVIYVARFFDVMLPILAVGGLVQYISGIPNRPWSILIIVISLLVAVLASLSAEQRLDQLVLVTRFFDVSLPVLGVGALIKYLGLHSRIWAGLIILLALISAILAVVLPQPQLVYIMYSTRFFDVMLPILGAGALVKYLFVRCCGSQKSTAY